jgi:CheY-like chemotaxis protein
METAKKILLVDDDLDVIAVVETILVNEGYDVITACNKEEGLSLAKSEKPNLAILDVMMTTQYEGFELAEAFVKSKEFAAMPVMLQTSIEVFESTDDDVMNYARNYRQKRVGKEMDVLLIQNYQSKNAGIDYRDEDGKNHWLPVRGFIRKPVNAKTLISSIQGVLEN